MRTRHVLVVAALLTSTAVFAHPTRTGKLEGTAATARGAVDCNLAGRAGMPGCPNDDFAAASVAMAEVRAERSQNMVANRAEQYPSQNTDPNAPLSDNTYAPGNVPATSGSSTSGTTGSSSTLTPPPPIVDPSMSDTARNRSNPAVGDLPTPAGRVQDSTTTPPPPPRQY